MTAIRRRLKKLEASMRAKDPASSAEFMDVHQAALEKLSDADRDLIRENRTEDPQAYEEMCTRWDTALANTARELNYHGYIHRLDLGWL